ncbi:probable ubiquitin-like-specific protease 2A isoform X2 [Gastrolobium bilobum]|uniref:probable ubiquitin-like-specific protease 2A isoform X2 n=1 Tax=Gastrolobium bilobum TaxID=150636 RepID=UPI002AAF9354|nr:probable ubiquitin-like-specific protease 2A isoform X2 [Gastrolobium bilobum]
MTRCKQSCSSSATKKFEVFEFNEDEEEIEKVSQMMLDKFTNPSKSCSSPITKYDFLQAFARGSQPLSKHVTGDPIDLDAEEEEETKCSQEEVTNKSLEVDDDDGVGGSGTSIDNQDKCANSCSINIPLQNCTDEEITGYTDIVESNFDLKNQSLDMVSEDDDDSSQIGSSTSISNLSEFEVNLEDKLVELGSTAFEINDIKKMVDVFPDFIQYEDLYSTRSRLIFSCCFLKLEGSTINGTRETFKIEWATEDIIKIESSWLGKIETAMINLHLKSKDSGEAGNTNQNPDFKQLKFAVYDSCWFKAEAAIKSLDMRYANMWSSAFDIDTDNNGNISALGKDSFFSQKHYFTIFDETFDEVIYPRGEPDAVSISKRDVELLQPETFINDTIIDFYIKYLKNKLPTDEQDRFHFFNSFFFRKLADLDKDPSSAYDGRAAFQRVRKWTRKVNLFKKDYILIPINYSLHWSLIVICHPGEVTCFRDEEIKESSKVPCILHMDSLKGSHKGLKNLFQSYLCEEWRERHQTVVDDDSSKFLHLRFISLELPQQENFYDCGLFLLHYVERFLEEAPINFNPFKITKFSNFLNSNWFPPPEASLKRSDIHNLIHDIFENNSLQAPPADCLDKGPPSEVPGIIKHKVETDSLGGCCYPALWYGKNPSNSTTELETDIQFPTASPVRVASCMRQPGLVSKDLGGAILNSRSDCRQKSACHQRGFMSPTEETEGSCEETALSLKRVSSQAGILASNFPSKSYISKDHRASETSQQGLSVNFVEAVEGHSYSRTSTSVPWNTFNTGTHEDQPLEKILESNIPDKTDIEHLSTSGEELADSVVQDSQEGNDGHEVDVSVKSRSSLQENMNSVTDHIFDLAQNMILEDDTLIRKKEPLASEPGEGDAKRPKLVNAGGPSRRLTRGMLKEACLTSCE